MTIIDNVNFNPLQKKPLSQYELAVLLKKMMILSEDNYRTANTEVALVSAVKSKADFVYIAEQVKAAQPRVMPKLVRLQGYQSLDAVLSGT